MVKGREANSLPFTVICYNVYNGDKCIKNVDFLIRVDIFMIGEYNKYVIYVKYCIKFICIIGIKLLFILNKNR